MVALAKCPCGTTPGELCVTLTSEKWGYVRGLDCCGDWEIEFRTICPDSGDTDFMRLATKAWNGAKRERGL